MRLRPVAVAAAFVALVAAVGCSSLQSADSFLGVITPYKLEIVQGNVVTREQAALVRPGMTRAQVKDVLGSPLLADPFHADRRDYVFSIRRQGAEPQLRRVIVLFEGERMRSLEGGGDLPGEREFVASIDAARTARSPRPLALSDVELAALPAPARPAASQTAPPPPARSYPPLEPAP